MKKILKNIGPTVWTPYEQCMKLCGFEQFLWFLYFVHSYFIFCLYLLGPGPKALGPGTAAIFGPAPRSRAPKYETTNILKSFKLLKIESFHIFFILVVLFVLIFFYILVQFLYLFLELLVLGDQLSQLSLVLPVLSHLLLVISRQSLNQKLELTHYFPTGL